MERELNGFGTNCLRIILGIKRIDKVPNTRIYELTDMKPLTCFARERQLRYLGRVLRLEVNEPARKFALYRPEHGRLLYGFPVFPYDTSLGSYVNM
jgi:hypothetical protein